VGEHDTTAAAPAVLARVRKLLALATSSNPHEAALAAARAQAIIEAHRLEGWLAAAHDVAQDPDPIVDARDTPLEVARKLRKWKVALASALAQVNGCVAYVRPCPGGDALVLVGRARDREAVHALWEWLVKRIEWLSATHGAGRSRQWHDAFRIGVVDEVTERLDDGRAHGADELSSVALVAIDPLRAAHRDALDRFIEDNLGLTPGRGMRLDARAYDRGRGAAAELELVSKTPARRRS
jgi:Protein of unknown function (DUF2786)